MNKVCDMPVALWKDLIFPYFILNDLVHMRRTCKAFSSYDVLKNMVNAQYERDRRIIGKAGDNFAQETQLGMVFGLHSRPFRNQ